MINLKTDIFDIVENIQNKEKNTKYKIIEFKYKINLKKYNTNSFIYKTKKDFKALAIFIGFIKYISTSTLIFTVLLLTANYSAYIDVAKSYLYADEIKKESTSLLNSVEASKITSKLRENKEINKKISEDIIKSKKSKYSIKNLVLETNKKKPKLDIEITPYENRIIIPKITKNIPLLDVKQKSVSWAKELENILMKELEEWVVRYPGSTKPGKDWNTFIFGHSSNYPWIKWNYNDVFANLNKLEKGEEIIVYYEQEKYTYKVKEKKVITPGQTDILKRNKNKDEITLMTCWPLWTTLNRLIVIWEIVKNK